MAETALTKLMSKYIIEEYGSANSGDGIIEKDEAVGVFLKNMQKDYLDLHW